MRTSMLVSAAALAALVACGGDAEKPKPSRVPAEWDAILFQEVLDGVRPASQGLLDVAWSGGWPIETSQGFLFAIADDGRGPFTLESPDGAFPATPLKAEAGVAWAILPVAAPTGVGYRFRTAEGRTFLDPLARYLGYPGGRETTWIRPAPGAHLERWPGIGDATILPRSLRVWVPAEPPTHFLYTHDGQNLFSPYANAGGWQLQRAGGPTTLIVGIDNSSRRFDEYTPVPDFIAVSGPPETIGGLGDAYADYVENTVRPFIESRYGTPQRVGLMGSSLGGLIAYHEVLRHPGAYDFVASLSGTMGWGSIGATPPNETIIHRIAVLDACPDATLYLDSGGGPDATFGCADADHDGTDDDYGTDNYCENLELKTVLESKGCTVHYVWAENAGHNEGAWRARAPAILQLFESL